MKRPNIIYILVDDLGYGDFASLNGGLTETPRLDALMAESLCLSQHYTASPVCNPSRAALLTGRYPQRTGSIDTLEWRGLERLNLDEVTLADIFKGAGYRTGLIGKWHLGAFDPAYKPERRGFDEAICFRGGMHDYYDWRLEHGENVLRADGRYLTDLWSDEAIEFLERHQNDEFFLHLTYNAPHTPLQAPEEDLAVFAGREELTPAVRTLYAMIRRLDAGIGRVLDALDRLGLRENTLVVFSSDNGPQFGGEGDQCLNRFNGGLHGSKGSTYDGGIRAPAILRWPDGLPGDGLVKDEFIHMTDWLPTLLSLAGIPVPQDLALDGIDQSSVLRGDKGVVNPQRCWQWSRYQVRPSYNAAIRDGDWKLIRPYVPAASLVPKPDIDWLEVCMYQPEHFLENGIITDPPPHVDFPEPLPSELYDLKNDPGESRNLALEESEKLSLMESQLDAWFEDIQTGAPKS